ncbi:MAG TPA: hypothetical protein VKF60_01745 [Myxococcota bacterium]|nr:hypothetical protein [Myxococcota bacterium]
MPAARPLHLLRALEWRVAHEHQPRELAELGVLGEQLRLVGKAQARERLLVALQIVQHRGELHPVLLVARRHADQALQSHRDVGVVALLAVDRDQELHPALLRRLALLDRQLRRLERQIELLLLHEDHRLQVVGVGLGVRLGREPPVDQLERAVVATELCVELRERVDHHLLGLRVERLLRERLLELLGRPLVHALVDVDVAAEAVDLRRLRRRELGALREVVHDGE